ASKCPAVVVLHVSFSYPVVFVRCSNRFTLNQMSPVVMLVHVARLSQRKVLLLLRYGVVDLLVLGGVRGSLLAVRLAAAYWVLGLAEFRHQSRRVAALLSCYLEKAACSRYQAHFGSFVNVIVLSQAVCS